MASREFCFLSVNHPLRKDADRRTWELERARALSHAAKWVNQERRWKEAEKERQDDGDPSGPSTRGLGSSASFSEALLDPFVSLSMDLSLEDRNLLHGCEFPHGVRAGVSFPN
jgi:hypothetical protein